MSTQEHISILLRSHGLRVTPQRLAVAELVLPEPMHATARMVYQKLRKTLPTISMNTIYLTLGQFESSGLLHHFEINGNTIFDSNTTPHDHACCKQCGKIVDLESKQLAHQRFPEELNNWRIDCECHIWLGVCQMCDKACKDRITH